MKKKSLTTRKAVWLYLISRMSVCLTVCVYLTITFESLAVGSSFSLSWYLLREYVQVRI